MRCVAENMNNYVACVLLIKDSKWKHHTIQDHWIYAMPSLSSHKLAVVMAMVCFLQQGTVQVQSVPKGRFTICAQASVSRLPALHCNQKCIQNNLDTRPNHFVCTSGCNAMQAITLRSLVCILWTCLKRDPLSFFIKNHHWLHSMNTITKQGDLYSVLPFL